MTSLPSVTPQQTRPTLLGATERRLEECGRADSPEGVLVLELARQIDAGGHSGASLASLSTAYTKALDQATKDAAPEADVIDRIFSAG